MVLKNIYYASKTYILSRASESGLQKRFGTNYYFTRGNQELHIVVKTYAALDSLDSIAQEEYLQWRISPSKKDFYRRRDYETILKSLTAFGVEIRKRFIESNTDITAENFTSDLIYNGFRPFKDFEENALLDALKNNI